MRKALIALLSFFLMFHTLPSGATDLSTDLIAYWNFENGSTLGTPFYGDLNLTDVNSPSYTATGGYNSSKGLSLNGSSYLRATSYPSSLNGNGAYTIAAWFKTTTGNNGGILGYGEGGTCKGNNLRLFGSTRLHSYWYSCDLSSNTVSNFVNSWHHVAVTYNGTTQSFYYDGAFLNSGTGKTRATTGTVFLLGKTINDVSFSGVLDEVAIYTRALSPVEVQQLRNGGLNSTSPAISVVPTISGTTTFGETLTSTYGTWTNTPTSYSYQWSQASTSGGSYANISGATSSTYNLVTADVGKYLKSTVTATNAGGSASSTSTATAQIAKATPTFSTWDDVTKTFGNDTYTVTSPTVTGSIAGSFTYSSSNSSVISISGSTFTVAGGGSETITATFTPTDTANYNSATVTNIVTVNKADQSAITISPSSGSYGTPIILTTTGGNGTGSVTYSAADGTPICTISGETLTADAAGTCLVTATKASDTNYNSVVSSAASITFAAISTTASISLASGALTYRQAKLITAFTSVAGKVTFRVNNKILPRCKKKLTTGSTPNIIATCSYRPSNKGSVTISATLNPTNSSYIGTVSTSDTYFVYKRTGARGG